MYRCNSCGNLNLNVLCCCVDSTGFSREYVEVDFKVGDKYVSKITSSKQNLIKGVSYTISYVWKNEVEFVGNVVVEVYNFYNMFYTKKEIRKKKLDKINKKRT